jgi:TRAP-type C4-dicarboxylate transport system permease small subunit
MKLLIQCFIFMVLWIVGGQVTTHFFYPEFWETESTKHALPWLLFIGYAVGTVSLAISSALANCFKRK